MKTYGYVLAYGRSGSTLLDWQLDSHPEVLGLGEIGRLPDSLRPNARMPKYCGCGSILKNCEFWNPILRYGREYGENGYGFESWNKKLISLILINKPDTQVILDSSGNLLRLKKLLAAGFMKNYQLRILFLTRDARGVVYSASSRGYRGGEIKPSVVSASVSWFLRNHQFVSFLKQIPKHQYRHITYERLCLESDKVLNSVHHFLGIEARGFTSDWKSRPHHSFGGNRRLRQSEETRLRFDHRWMYRLGFLQTFIVDAIAGRLNRRLQRGFIR